MSGAVQRLNATPGRKVAPEAIVGGMQKAPALIVPGTSGLRDAWHEAAEQCRALGQGLGLRGYGVAELREASTGATTLLVPFANRVTTAGDQYYAQKGIVGVGPTPPSAPTAVNGMKLGTSTSPATKSGAGAALVTYLAGSQVLFNSGYPQATAQSGTDAGWNAVYQSIWGAGTATSATINEVAIVTDAGTNATTTAANTISRAVLTTVNKDANSTLTVTWNHLILGA